MRQRINAALERLSSWKRAPLALLALGLALVAPSLGSGLAADDWFHRLVLTGNDTLGGIHHRALDLFVFSDGDPAVGHAQQEAGLLGWWADPSAAIAYFRPLSAATHWLDYRLWPELPWVMHAHSLAWFGLGLYALSRLYARCLAPPRLAVLALLLYAIDDSHGFVVSWIANRNALIALALGLPVIVLHDRARRGGERWPAFVAPGLFGVALLAGESAASVAGYVIAYALFVDAAPARRRAASLLPYAVVFVLWRSLYAALGHGTHGSGLAVDPLHEPLHYLLAVGERLPVLLLAQLALPPSDLWEVLPVVAPWLKSAVYALAVLVIGGFGWALGPALRREPTTRFWALGTVLSALPACSQVPSDRLLLFAGVGAHALVARLLGAVLAGELAEAVALRRRAVGALVIVLGAVHLLLAPLWLPLRSRGPADVTSVLAVADRTLPSDEGVRDRTVVLVNPPADAYAGYLPMMRAGSGRRLPGRLRWLATGASPANIERVDDRTLRVELPDGFLSLASERMQRGAGNPMPVGYTVTLTGMRVEVTRLTDDRRPREILVRFDLALDSPTLQLLQWTPDGYGPFVPPAIGERLTLPAIDFTKLAK